MSLGRCKEPGDGDDRKWVGRDDGDRSRYTPSGLGSQLDHTLRQASLCFKSLFICRITVRPRSLIEMHWDVIRLPYKLFKLSNVQY